MYHEFNKRLEKAKKGDSKAVEQILNDLHPLIISSIKRYYYRLDLFDDLIQDGRIVIIECINNYDEAKGVFFLGYVKTMLRYTYLNKHRDRSNLSLNEKIGNDEEDELIDLLESKEESAIEKIIKFDENQALRQAIIELPMRQRQVIISYFYEELTISQIAKKYNIAYRTVVNVKTGALKNLKGIFAQLDNKR
ncbi:MAG: sigma-70 family RNA polymerase sigma factor [Tissierellia bacterium]|nr:sigma-70 family RNA polymerase sigma factor [Tissierellia bacterium]